VRYRRCPFATFLPPHPCNAALLSAVEFSPGEDGGGEEEGKREGGGKKEGNWGREWENISLSFTRIPLLLSSEYLLHPRSLILVLPLIPVSTARKKKKRKKGRRRGRRGGEKEGREKEERGDSLHFTEKKERECITYLFLLFFFLLHDAYLFCCDSFIELFHRKRRRRRRGERRREEEDEEG
jgi:hypothetical protein